MQPIHPLDDPDDAFSEHLAALDEALAAGEDQDLPSSTPPHLRARLSQARTCLFLLNSMAGEKEAPSHGTKEIGRFRVVRELGRGGCGVVFLAHDPVLHREVALKVPLPEILATAEFRRRFLREAQAAAQLNHPNVVAVYESGEAGPIAYIASAYSPGLSLAAWLKKQKAPVPPSAAATLLLVLAQAVHHCHTRGVLHRDLKPGNVLLETDEGKKRTSGAAATAFSALAGYKPKIADFGLAHVEIGGDRTATGTIMGTAAYMAPEQAQGRLDAIGPFTDVYALGVILFELLAGQPPFRGAASELQTMQQVIQEDPPPLSRLRQNVHCDLETICRKCLEKEPRRRYANAEELAQDLQRFCSGESILARPVSNIERAWRWSRRHPTVTSLFTLSFLILLIVGPSWFSYEQSLRESATREELAQQTAAQELKARQAAEQNADTQRYFGLLNRLRRRNSQRPLGWTWTGLHDLAELAKIDVPSRDLVDLRSEAATLLAGVDFREKTTLTDSFSAYCLAFSPDGRFLAAGQDLAAAFFWAPVRIYDLTSGKLRFELSYPVKLAQLPTGLAPDGAVCMDFSADGKLLIVGTRSGQAHCWDLTRDQPKPLSWQAAAPRRVNEVYFHPHKPVAYTVSHGDRFIKTWDATTGKELAQFDAGKGSVHGISVHKDGRTLAGLIDNKITYFDADSLREIGKPRHENNLFTLCYSPDGRFLAAQAGNGIALLFDPIGFEVRRFAPPGAETAHRGPIDLLRFSPDGSLLYTSSESDQDRTLKVWEVASGRLLANLPLGESGPLACAVNRQGNSIATCASRRLVLHEIAGHEVESFRAHHPHNLQSLAFAPSGEWLACSGELRTSSHIPMHFFSLWQAEPERLLHWRALSNDADKSTWNPLALAFHPSEPVFAVDGWAHNTSLYKLDKQIPPSLAAKEPGLLAFDRAGTKLWTVLDEKNIQSWLWKEGKVASTWQNQSLQFAGRDQLYCLTAGRHWLLAGARDGKTHLLRTIDGKLQASWPGPNAPIRSLAISASEAWAAVGSQNGLVRIMSLPAGNILATLQDHLGSVDGLAIDPTDRFLLTCSTENRVHLYTLHAGLPKLFATLTLPTGPVRSLCFRPDGKQFALITGSESALRSWNLEKLQQRFTELGVMRPKTAPLELISCGTIKDSVAARDAGRFVAFVRISSLTNMGRIATRQPVPHR